MVVSRSSRCRLRRLRRQSKVHCRCRLNLKGSIAKARRSSDALIAHSLPDHDNDIVEIGDPQTCRKRPAISDVSKVPPADHRWAVWLPNAVADPSLPVKHVRSSRNHVADPALELQRMRSVKALRHKMRKLCSRHGFSVPLLAFERWHARAMLHEQCNLQDECVNPLRIVPLLPFVDTWVDQGLIRDLKRVWMEDSAAEAVAVAMSSACNVAAKALTPTPLESLKCGAAHAFFKRHQVDLSLGKGGKPFFTLNMSHYHKLKALYLQYHQRGEEIDDVRDFHDRLLCILACMEALQGAGYQAALPPSAFELLQKRLGVALECFASPLNCTLPCFCSLLPHVDGAFGSRGSFFEFWVDQGSFEMNPPFVPEVMTAAVRHAEELLANSRGAMSFAIFVPAWREVACWDQLQRSSWRQGKIELLAAKDHVFSDGNQHRAHTQFRPASFDTAVAFLQNTEGAKRWPVTPEVLEQLRRTVSATGERSVPALQQWEQRGSAKGGRQGKGYKSYRKEWW